MQPNLSAIYLITCLINGKQYVGQAKNLRARWVTHRNAALGKPSQSYSQKTAIARAMRKYGFENFEMTILEACEVDQLDERGPYSPERCAAIAAGMTEEGKLRTKAASMAPEARERNRLSHVGKKRTPEQCERMASGQHQRWQELSDDEKKAALERMDAARALRPPYHPTEEVKQKISATLKARNAARKQDETDG
jgi:group I intron endonuclease